MREAVGTRADILIGTHGQITPSAARRFAARFFRASVDAAAADRARARALEAWLGEVVQLAAWGTLAPRACWAVRDALLYDECVVVEPSPAKAASRTPRHRPRANRLRRPTTSP